MPHAVAISLCDIFNSYRNLNTSLIFLIHNRSCAMPVPPFGWFWHIMAVFGGLCLFHYTAKTVVMTG
jgi:hypothetical protein